MKTINLIIAFLLISISSMAQQYEYDELNRITKVSYPSGQTVFYSYDELGNRQAKSQTLITSVEEVIINEAISVFPNPAKNRLNIRFTNTEYQNVTIEFTNISGQTVLTKQLSGITKNSKEELNISALPSGTYILRLLSTGTVISSKKIIISD